MRQLPAFHWSGDAPASGEAYPNGPWVVSVPGVGIFTSFRGDPIPAPPGNRYALYVRLSKGGKIACVGSDDHDQIWEYTNGKWNHLGAGYGPKSVIYVGEQAVWIKPPGPANGYRCVRNNVPVFAVPDTYADPIKQIFEWTPFEDLSIGQGDDDKVGGGVVVRFSLESFNRRLAFDELGLGPVRDLVVNRDLNDFAIVAVDLRKHITTITYASRTELSVLPLVNQSVPPIDPDPEEPPVSTPNFINIIRDTDREHPELLQDNTHETAGLFTEWAAWDLHQADAGFGLLSKSPGENSYNGHAVDAVIYKPTQQVIDIISQSGTGDSTSVSWQEQPKRPNNNWLQPFEPDDQTGDPPDEEPDDDDHDHEAITVKLVSLQNQIDELAVLVDDLSKIVEAVIDDEPEYEAFADCGRNFAHTHKISVTIRKKP